MFVKHNLFTTLQNPASAISYGALRTVAAALLCIGSCCRGSIPEFHMSFRQVVGIYHSQSGPATEDNVEVLWQCANNADVAVYDVILLCEAQDFTMRIRSGDVYHVLEIRIVRNVARDMETKKSRHHDGRLDLSPIGSRIALQNFKIVPVRIGYIRAKPFKPCSVALLSAAARSAGYSGGQGYTWDVSHLGIAA